MVKKTIFELNDILLTQESSAVVAIEQNGATFKGPIRPNPPRQINVLSQAQLEAELGTDLEIPDNAEFSISIDDDMTLTKPFKMGLDSILEVYASTRGTALTYTGASAMFQNTNPANPINSVFLRNITIIGAPKLFDIIGTQNCEVNNVVYISCVDYGVVDIPNVLFNRHGIANMTRGLIIKNPTLVDIDSIFLQTFVSTGITLYSIITGANIPSMNIIGVISDITQTDESLVYVDSIPVNGILVTEKCQPGAGQMYQLGGNIPVLTVTDNGSGKIRCFTVTGHGIETGQVAVLSGFTESSYNGTFRITDISTQLFDVEDVSFIADDTGEIDGTSLNGTNVRVISRNNFNQPDSMFTGDAGLEVFGAPIISSSLAQDAFEVITSASWAFNNLERFSIGVNNEGQLVVDEPSTVKYKVDYSATLEKSGGGSLDIGIVILKNGVIESFNAPHTVNSGLVQVSGSDIVELVDTDTIQIAVINYDSSAAVINTSQVNMVINRA